MIVWYLEHPGMAGFARLGYRNDIDLLLVHSGNWKQLARAGYRIMQANVRRCIDLGSTVLFNPDDIVWSASGGKVDTTEDGLGSALVVTGVN